MLARVLKISLGLVLVVVGGALLVLPGPGTPLIVLGAGLVLSQSEAGRIVIARVRLWARRRFGSSPVRDIERRLPRDVVGPHDTMQLKDVIAAADRRREEQRSEEQRRGRRRWGGRRR